MQELERNADDLTLLESTMHEAGAIARHYFEGSYRHWDKGKGQPVTEADLAVDKFLRETLCKARPDYGWLSEETEDDQKRLEAESTFVIDPIDGTIAFLKGRPHFTICAAVVRRGEPVAGVIFNPITKECFAASTGKGATLNGSAIHTSTRNEIEGCRMLADKTLFAQPRWSEPPLTPWPAMELETRNSVAYRMALVAAGQFDAMLALSAKRDWDLAAGDLILREAGGKVSTRNGTRLRYNCRETVQPSVIGAGSALHAALLEKLAPLSPAQKEKEQ